jgi:phosphoribosyl 1,2-cyclic phosphodiesterase
MKRLGLSIKNIKAIFVTHEHGDHIHGVPVLSRKYKLPVYITHQTKASVNLDVSDELTVPFRSLEPITVGNLIITGFPKIHDAVDPFSFVVEHHGVRVGIFTDIGHSCSNVINHFKQCHAAFLESNYDEDMLDKGGYPFHLKNRIRGGKGHLSNVQAAELFVQHRPAFMTHLFLSHLSRNNNHPRIVDKLFKSVAAGTEIIIASRNKETRLYHIRKSDSVRIPVRNPLLLKQSQLSLFQLVAGN